MSSALAAAKRRRAFGQQNNTTQQTPPSTPRAQPEPQTSPAPVSTNKSMTINQAFKSMDERITNLDEKLAQQSTSALPEGLIEEYEQRFDMILNEIVNIKEILLKLQTFSMEVNKSLHDERIKILSDIDSNSLQTDNIQEVMNDTHNVTQIQTINLHTNEDNGEDNGQDDGEDNTENDNNNNKEEEEVVKDDENVNIEEDA